MISSYARWIFRQQTYLLLIATAVYVTSDNSTGNCIDFHTSLQQSFSECTIVIEAKCFNITTAKVSLIRLFYKLMIDTLYLVAHRFTRHINFSSRSSITSLHIIPNK